MDALFFMLNSIGKFHFFCTSREFTHVVNTLKLLLQVKISKPLADVSSACWTLWCFLGALATDRMPVIALENWNEEVLIAYRALQRAIKIRIRGKRRFGYLICHFKTNLITSFTLIL